MKQKEQSTFFIEGERHTFVLYRLFSQCPIQFNKALFIYFNCMKQFATQINRHTVERKRKQNTVNQKKTKTIKGYKLKKLYVELVIHLLRTITIQTDDKLKEKPT